jgi:hypothetical protein
MTFKYTPGTDDPEKVARAMIKNLCEDLRYRDLMDAEENARFGDRVGPNWNELAAIADEHMIAKYDERYVQNLTLHLQYLDLWVVPAGK